MFVKIPLNISPGTCRYNKGSVFSASDRQMAAETAKTLLAFIYLIYE